MLDLYLNIKNYREKSGMSQEELAKLVGYKNRTSIAKIEAGKIDLPLSKIELFADALGVTPTELMGETWENEILDNARLDITNYFGGDAYEIAKFQEAEQMDAQQVQSDTLVKHFNGDESTFAKSSLTPKDKRDISKTVNELMEKLDSNDGAPLFYDGEEMDEQTKLLFRNQLNSLVTTVKEINKVKYNPNKNKGEK